ncbi:MAG: GNAT family N-acetyltransferase [Anaerolineales bacterium]|nr:GNAT family N-acetyltransferase [Anaerolineales bacterium]MDW8276873.1 N-acetyltransferase [Anaerolineales bacterium]
MTATFALTPVHTCAAPGRMRPLNVLRDLPAVADLIELCFQETLDPEGRSYIDQMRRNGQDSGFLDWAPRVIESVSLPLSGFVWEDEGQIVGNVSLVPFHKRGRKIFMIANVATHPNYRRQGIARALMEATLLRARDKHATSIWLHVRQDNPGAIALYRDLGFYERARRTTWYATPGGLPPESKRRAGISIRPPSSWDWPQQNHWLETAYPTALDWYFAQRWKSLRPGLFHRFYRFLADIDVLQWAAYRDGQLGAVLSCQRTNGRSDTLWLAAPRRPDPELLTGLLLHARHALAERHSLMLEFPTGPADESLRAAGFIPQRTLVWMEAPGAQPR